MFIIPCLITGFMLENTFAVPLPDLTFSTLEEMVLVESKEIKQSISIAKKWKKAKDAVAGYLSKAKDYVDYLKPSKVDYGKIWSYLKGFTPLKEAEKADYEAPAKEADAAESTREMVSTETIDKALWDMKYLGRSFSFIPSGGVDSKEWEKFLLMLKMSIYRPLLMAKYAAC